MIFNVFLKNFNNLRIVKINYEYTFLYLVWVQFSEEIDFNAVSYLRKTRI